MAVLGQVVVDLIARAHGVRSGGVGSFPDPRSAMPPSPSPAVRDGASLSEVLAAFGSGPGGLSPSEAARRLAEIGPNEAEARGGPGPLLRFLAKFLNPLVMILLFASALSAATGNLASFAIVVVMVAASVTLDFVQEMRAEGVVEALRRSVALTARVVRDGQPTTVAVSSLVPGDVVQLAAGDLVPADCRLTAANDLFLNEALLTGEPYPVEKRPGGDGTPGPEGPDDRLSMGTSVISGAATAVIVATGSRTRFGQLAHTLATNPPPTAFETGVRRFGFLILRLTVFLVLFVTTVNVASARPWLESLMFALALAVGLTPELLPMIVTVTLARGATRLAARRVVVKRLASMHNLGAMDVLCTDKTGTLTAAKIQMVRHIGCTGADSERVFRLAWINSHFETGIRSALDQAILEHGMPDVTALTKIDEVPFDFERRRVSVLVADGVERWLVVKGAPEDVLALSTAYEAEDGTIRPLDEAARAGLAALFAGLGEQGFRALGIASRAMPADHRSAVLSDESALVFAGYAVFLDPPKPSAAAAVAALAGAGVSVKILTGDNERVTRHVCAELGIAVEGLLTGDDLRAMGEEALAARLAATNVYCRVTPHQKERVLSAYRKTGRVVGFLGDGINDSSALHAADVGISVDSGADVAKEAAGVILLDQDLGVVHEAVIEGRRTVENVTKYVLMGASSNFGNMLSMAGASLFLPFLPMAPTQVLLNNLLYDASEAGIPFDRVDEAALVRPVRWDLTLIQRFMLVLGPVSSVFDFLTFAILIALFGSNEALFQTGWFVESLATQVLVIFVIRTRGSPLAVRAHPALAVLAIAAVAIGWIIPLTPLGHAFGFAAPPAAFYLLVVALVGVYLVLVEAVKRLFFRRIAGRAFTGWRRP